MLSVGAGLKPAPTSLPICATAPSVAGWQTRTRELDEAGENAAQRWTM